MSNNILLATLCLSVSFGLAVVLYVLIKEEIRIRNINKQVDSLLRDNDE